MEINIFRYNSEADFTQGLFIIDKSFQCYTIEDEQRTIKVWGETAIPNGRYRIKLRTEGKFHEQYKVKFPDMHIGMLHVTDVPGFEYILIHIGNDDDDTAGCLLPGMLPGKNNVSESTVAYKLIYPIIAAALKKGEDVFINYSNIAA